MTSPAEPTGLEITRAAEALDATADTHAQVAGQALTAIREARLWQDADASANADGAPARSKPTADQVLDQAGLAGPEEAPWQSAGEGDGAIELAVLTVDGVKWGLLRVKGTPDLISVYDEHELDCFLDGVRKGEFIPPQDTGPEDGGAARGE